MNLSYKDLEYLNAYHDGELGAAEAQEMARRLETEPALREALASVREVSEALGALRPPLAETPAPAPRAALSSWMKVAAALAGVAVLASGILWSVLTGHPHSPAGWHEHFVAQSYPEESGAVPTPVSKWIAAEPDLSAANLRLVDVAGDGGSDVYLHYAGENGCRLTFGAHAGTPDLPAATGGLLVHDWSTGEISYSLIADGMDRGKFSAIMTLLEEQTRTDDTGDATVMALSQATGNALPCA